MTFFMHLKWTTPLVRFFALVALFFLVIMFAFTLSDYISRPFVGH
jgi:cytochrome c oxidase subunit 4